MLKRVQALNVYERKADVCVPVTPERGVPSFFRLDRRERFLFCSSVTQPVREMRSTLVGNTLLGNTLAPTHIRTSRRLVGQKAHSIPSPGHHHPRHRNCRLAR